MFIVSVTPTCRAPVITGEMEKGRSTRLMANGLPAGGGGRGWRRGRQRRCERQRQHGGAARVAAAAASPRAQHTAAVDAAPGKSLRARKSAALMPKSVLTGTATALSSSVILTACWKSGSCSVSMKGPSPLPNACRCSEQAEQRVGVRWAGSTVLRCRRRCAPRRAAAGGQQSLPGTRGLRQHPAGRLPRQLRPAASTHSTIARSASTRLVEDVEEGDDDDAEHVRHRHAHQRLLPQRLHLRGGGGAAAVAVMAAEAVMAGACRPRHQPAGTLCVETAWRQSSRHPPCACRRRRRGLGRRRRRPPLSAAGRVAAAAVAAAAGEPLAARGALAVAGRCCCCCRQCQQAGACSPQCRWASLATSRRCCKPARWPPAL